METLRKLTLEGQLGAARFGMTEHRLFELLGPPPGWFAMPGTIGAWHERDFWKARIWYYESDVVGFGFDEQRSINRLLVDLSDYELRPIPHWFVGWFPPPGTRIGELKCRLSDAGIPSREHIYKEDYWLLFGDRAYALTLGKTASPDILKVELIISYRDERDLRTAVPGLS